MLLEIRRYRAVRAAGFREPAIHSSKFTYTKFIIVYIYKWSNSFYLHTQAKLNKMNIKIKKPWQARFLPTMAAFPLVINEYIYVLGVNIKNELYMLKMARKWVGCVENEPHTLKMG